MGGTVSSSERAPPSPTIVLEPPLSKVTPDWKTGTTSAEPNYGFEGKRRKEREMVASLEELQSAKVPLKFRDFCAHRYIAFEKCKKDKFPFVYRCHHEKHEYEHCAFEDHVIRMKEYERERRLLHRKVRKEEKAKKAAAAASADD